MSTIKDKFILSRMWEAIREEGLNKTKVAKITGYSKAQVGDILEDRVPLSDKFIRIFASSFKISEQWLETGEGEMRPPPTVQEPEGAYAPRLSRDELYLLRTFRRLHPAEQEKVIEIAELYAGVKESRNDVGGGSDCAESKSA